MEIEEDLAKEVRICKLRKSEERTSAWRRGPFMARSGGEQTFPAMSALRHINTGESPSLPAVNLVQQVVRQELPATE